MNYEIRPADALFIPDPGKVLCRDGVWQVPPRQRPNGWQSLGLREPDGSVAVQPMRLTHQAVKRWNPPRPKGNAPGKWTIHAMPCARLAVGKEARLKAREGYSLTQTASAVATAFRDVPEFRGKHFSIRKAASVVVVRRTK